MSSVVHQRIDVNWLNGMVRTAPGELVVHAECLYNEQIKTVSRSLVDQSNRFSILLLSGPSASTKTTTAGKLADCMQKQGVRTVVISLDNFFIDRAFLPKRPDGTTDYESVHTLDLPLLSRCLDELLKQGESEFPEFDFATGKRSSQVQHIQSDRDTIVILEGIHALHPIIAAGHDPNGFRKLYISPNSEYFLGEERLLGIRDLRLIRRLVRDYFHRGNSVQNTLEMWVGVLEHEVTDIIPYRADADYILDSAMLYEPNIFRGVLPQILEQSNVGAEFRSKLDDLTAILKQFVPLELSHLPEHTVLWEFLQ